MLSSISIEPFDQAVHARCSLDGFFEGWPSHPDRDGFLRLLSGSYRAFLAVDKSEEKVYGFITAHSDGVLSAYIPFLEVLPEARGKGLGKKLVSVMLEELSALYMIDLCCDPELESFYEPLGFFAGRAMLYRNYAAQAGSCSAKLD